MQTTDDGSSNKPAVSNDMESPSGSSGSDDGGADPKHSSTTSTGESAAGEERRTKRTIPLHGLGQSAPPSTTASEASFEERLRMKLMDGAQTTSKEQQTPLKVGTEAGQKNLNTSLNDGEGDVDAANKERMRMTLNHRSQSMPTSTSTFEERLRRKMDEGPRRCSLDELETFEDRVLQKKITHQEGHQEDSAILSCYSDEKEDVKDAPSVGDEYGIINAQVQVSFNEPEPVPDEEEGEAVEAEPRTTLEESTSSRFSHDSFQRTLSTLPSKRFLQATLVPAEEEGDVIEAEPLGLVERKWKLLAIPVALALSLLAILLSLTLTGVIDVNGDEPMDNKQPTLAPTYDPRSSIEIIRGQGYLQCGLRDVQITFPGFNFDLCRSMAAVVLGNPDSIKAVVITTANRWEKLNDRSIDLLLLGDTVTVERQTKEPSTGVGFTFSSVYNYDGMVFFGHETFVKCAEEFKRYDECSALKICVTAGSTHYGFVKEDFPLDFIVVSTIFEERLEMILNRTCNVATYDKSVILPIASSKEFIDKNFSIGSKLMTKEPLAMATRNSDSEFSDIINWVLQALIYGEETGLTKDPTLCQNSTNLAFTNTQDLDFMNAVYCVGNYGEIFDGDLSNRGMNQINNGTGTGGLLYAIPFGNLEKENDVDPSSTLAKIRDNGTLNCGVLVPGDFVGNVTNSTGLVGMGVEYCRTLAAALFVGDYDSANLIPYEESSTNTSYVALANGDIDVFMGARVHKKFDFEQPPSLEGVHFSTPYYYGGGDNTTNEKTFFAIATSEDDPLFSSFVDTIVLATIHAQENNIDREKRREMPLVSVFGDAVSWALRDAIYYSGGYDEIYVKNFGGNGESEAHRGRNALNGGGPMLLSIPGLG